MIVKHLFRKPRRELCVDDVTRHLAFAFSEFLERQKNKDGVDENKQSVLSQAKELIASAFDLPEEEADESLKVKIHSKSCLYALQYKWTKYPLIFKFQISRHLELIFMQNNRREIQPPQDKEDEESTKEDDSGDTEKDKSIADTEGIVADDDQKEELENDEGEVVIGDDGNWKRAKKRDDEDEEGKRHCRKPYRLFQTS